MLEAGCAALLTLALLGAQSPADEGARIRAWLESGPPEKCVDVLFVGDGYVEKDLAKAGKYWKDVGRYAKRLLDERPFDSYRKQFNIRAALVASEQRGCDLASNANEVPTALESHFNAPEGRTLVFRDSARLKSIVEGAGQTDVVFVMVNTEKYGGAGTVLYELKVRGRPCPAPTFSAQDTSSFLIAIHELGHSFADLADEYEESGKHESFPIPAEGDVRAANATLARCFDPTSFETLGRTVKWQHFLALPGARKEPWVHEGSYYRSEGVFRPWSECMMRSLGEPFCPVCAEEIAKAIHVACELAWDDAAWHKTQPLSSW